MKRYVLISTGVSSLTLGLAAFSVSLLAATSSPSTVAAVAGATSIEGRHAAAALDSRLRVVSSEFAPFTALSLSAAPLTPLDTTSVLLTQAAAASGTEPGLPRPPAAVVRIEDVNVTFYDCLAQGFCGDMYNGEPVYEGAAACSWDLPLGTRFSIESDPTRRVYVCSDRGLLADTWVDIFFYNPSDGWAWQQAVGRYATVRIVSMPSEEDS